MPSLVVETNLFARYIMAVRKIEKRIERKEKRRKNAKDDLMVNGNDIYSHFNDVLNVNEAKLCFPRARGKSLLES